MRTELIFSSLRGFVVAATALAVVTQTAAAAPILTPTDSGSTGIHITTDQSSDNCQWTLGGSHDVTTTFSSDGTISTNDQSPDAVSAKHSAALTGPTTAAGTLETTPMLPSRMQTATDTVQPRPKSKFKKLIFAAAILPIAAIALMVKIRRAKAASYSEWGTGDLVAMPHPVAGIAMGHIDNRKDKSAYPTNHPWYA